MKRVDPEWYGAREFYRYMVAAVAPRPIALVSTVSREGAVNLSPFSFFNLMGIDPPVVVFAPNRRSRDHSEKDTALNLREVPEAVVNMVHYDMLHQISLASAEFGRGINEFEKAGLTPVASGKVVPPRVGESLVQLECRVLEIREIGSMSLVVAEVILAHFSEKVLDSAGQPDILKMNWVARCGGDWYSRLDTGSMLQLPRPSPGIGVDTLPEAARQSAILTGHDLSILGSEPSLPPQEAIRDYAFNREIADIKRLSGGVCYNFRELLHIRVKELLAEGRTGEALLAVFQEL